MLQTIPFWQSSTVNGYEVSSCGKIRSTDRVVFGSNGRTTHLVGKELKTQVDKNGYIRVRLSSCGKKITLKMHREVACVFLPNPDNKPQVNHKDGNKQNNSVNNLEWCDNSENQIHAISSGLKTVLFAEKAPRTKFKVLVFDKSGNHKLTLCGNKEMKLHGFDFRLVNACLKGKRKYHKDHYFKTEPLDNTESKCYSSASQ